MEPSLQAGDSYSNGFGSCNPLNILGKTKLDRTESEPIPKLVEVSEAEDFEDPCVGLQEQFTGDELCRNTS